MCVEERVEVCVWRCVCGEVYVRVCVVLDVEEEKGGEHSGNLDLRQYSKMSFHNP